MKHSLCSGKVGAIAELLVCADLMKQGYQVFRAVSQSSDFDLVAIKNGKTNTIEVRSGTERNTLPAYKRNKKHPDIYALVFHHSQKIRYYDSEHKQLTERGYTISSEHTKPTIPLESLFRTRP